MTPRCNYLFFCAQMLSKRGYNLFGIIDLWLCSRENRTKERWTHPKIRPLVCFTRYGINAVTLATIQDIRANISIVLIHSDRFIRMVCAVYPVAKISANLWNNSVEFLSICTIYFPLSLSISLIFSIYLGKLAIAVKSIFVFALYW